MPTSLPYRATTTGRPSSQRGPLLFTILFLVGLVVIMMVIPSDRYVRLFDVTPQNAAPGTHTTMLWPLRMVALLMWIGAVCLSFLVYTFRQIRRRGR